MGKRGGNRTAKASECTFKVPEMVSRTARGFFVISRSGVQVRPPAPALPWGTSEYGGVPEWPKGTDCKSAGYAYGGSNPPAPTNSLKSHHFGDVILIFFSPFQGFQAPFFGRGCQVFQANCESSNASIGEKGACTCAIIMHWDVFQ